MEMDWAIDLGLSLQAYTQQAPGVEFVPAWISNGPDRGLQGLFFFWSHRRRHPF